MANTQRKYKGSLSLGKLDTALEAHEMLFGTLAELKVLGTFTVATYDDSHYPALQSLALLPTIGGEAPPSTDEADHMFNGEAKILGITMDVAVYRTK